MKEQLIKRYLQTRKQIEAVATELNLPTKGPRESLLIVISAFPYRQIKDAIFASQKTTK